MMNQFERLAREAVITDTIDKMTEALSPHQKRATVELNLRLQPKITNMMVGRTISHETMEEMKCLTHQCLMETFKECSDHFRKLGDWDAFAEIHWMRGKV